MRYAPPSKNLLCGIRAVGFSLVIFLSSGYALFSTNITDAIFMPVWIVLSVAGLVIAIYEFKNNKGFSLLLAGLTTISLLLSIFINGISNM